MGNEIEGEEGGREEGRGGLEGGRGFEDTVASEER